MTPRWGMAGVYLSAEMFWVSQWHIPILQENDYKFLLQRKINGKALLVFSLEADPQWILTKSSIMSTIRMVTGDSRPSNIEQKRKKK